MVIESSGVRCYCRHYAALGKPHVMYNQRIASKSTHSYSCANNCKCSQPTCDCSSYTYAQHSSNVLLCRTPLHLICLSAAQSRKLSGQTGEALRHSITQSPNTEILQLGFHIYISRNHCDLKPFEDVVVRVQLAEGKFIS